MSSTEILVYYCANLGFPFHGSIFVASSLNECCLTVTSGDNPAESIYVTASTSIVKLEVETVLSAESSCMVVAPCMRVKFHSDWYLVTGPLVDIHD